MEVLPRYLLNVGHDTREEWTRALIDEFASGGLIATNAPEFDRPHLLWALVQLRAVNGRTGAMFTGDSRIAQRLGYNTKDHPGKRCRDVLTHMGFFTQKGKVSRAANLLLSVPADLMREYPTLANSARGEVIKVTDLTAPKEAGPDVDTFSLPSPWEQLPIGG
jgi:hypothetical protein